MHTTTQFVIRVHFVEYLDKVFTTSSFMKEEGEINCTNDFKLFAEILVLTLEDDTSKKGDNYFLITEMETIVIQTKLSNRNNLSGILSSFGNCNQLLDNGVCLFLFELTATSWVNSCCRVQTIIHFGKF